MANRSRGRGHTSVGKSSEQSSAVISEESKATSAKQEFTTTMDTNNENTIEETTVAAEIITPETTTEETPEVTTTPEAPIVETPAEEPKVKSAEELKQDEILDLLRQLAAKGVLTETGNIRKDVRDSIKVTTIPVKRVLVAKSSVASVHFYCANPDCRSFIGTYSEEEKAPGSILKCSKCSTSSKIGKRAYADEFRLGFGNDWTPKS